MREALVKEKEIRAIRSRQSSENRRVVSAGSRPQGGENRARWLREESAKEDRRRRRRRERMGGTSSAWFALCDSYCSKCSLATKILLLIIVCAMLAPTASQRTRREGTFVSRDITRESSPSLKLRYSVSSCVFEYLRHIYVVFSDVCYLSPVVGVPLSLPVLISVEHSLVLRLLFAFTGFLSSEHDLFMDKHFGSFFLINTGLYYINSINSLRYVQRLQVLFVTTFNNICDPVITIFTQQRS